MASHGKALGKKAAKATGKKAAKATAKHTARGVASKAQRKPLRSVTLLGIGGVVGAAVGAGAVWVAGKSRRPSDTDSAAPRPPLDDPPG